MRRPNRAVRKAPFISCFVPVACVLAGFGLGWHFIQLVKYKSPSVSNIVNGDESNLDNSLFSKNPPPPPSPPPPTPPPQQKREEFRKSLFDPLILNENDEIKILETVSKSGLVKNDGFELARGLQRWKLNGRPGFIAITFADVKMSAQVLNWAHHTQKSKIPHIVGALDLDMSTLLDSQRIPNFPFYLKDLDGSNSHASASWKNFAIARLGQVRALLKLGYDALMTDIDVVWLSNPRAYFYCNGETLPVGIDCRSMPHADVAVSSDNLSPRLDMQNGAHYPVAGTFNTGIVFLRSNLGGKAFADAWYENLVIGQGRYGPLTSDQQVFNMMMREEGKWPGVKVLNNPDPKGRLVEAAEPKHPRGDGNVKVATLPLTLFANGHSYFVQHNQDLMGIAPLAVHATYTFDGAGSQAKQFRFKEAALWHSPEQEARSNGPIRALTFDAEPPAQLQGPPGLRTHLPVVAHHLASLRAALAIARALNRTLLLPHLRCFCDKTWGGHDNIFKSRCMYPGAEDGEYLPLMCPLDHLVSPTKWIEEGVDFQASGYLASPVENQVPTILRDAVVHHVSTVPGKECHAENDGLIATCISQGSSDLQIQKQLEKLKDVPILSVSNVKEAFCRFEDKMINVAFEQLVSKILNPVPWCSECHPEGCAHYIEKDVLETGSITSTRGGAHEMFCKDFAIPQGTCF
mmetsp:Transcript_25618/g.35387  ORF Transcript_25618/g.35387 Transcript_25618/m.35387 type:complete len:688 (-) Transcript_25618:168-2231(-)